MSLSSKYIHPENQEILWKTIHQIPYIQQLDETYKMNWFKSIIEKFHQANPHISTFDDLMVLNRQTILYIQSWIVEQQKQRMSVCAAAPIPSVTESVASRNLQENKTEMYTNMFSERNKEYEKMVEKPGKTDISFEESRDEPLQNIEELVKRHLEERENMVKDIIPPNSGELSPPRPPRG